MACASQGWGAVACVGDGDGWGGRGIVVVAAEGGGKAHVPLDVTASGEVRGLVQGVLLEVRQQVKEGGAVTGPRRIAVAREPADARRHAADGVVAVVGSD